MREMLLWVGRIAGLLGVVLAVIAVALRLGGSYQLGHFQSITILLAGNSAMVAACLAYIAAVAESGPR